MLRQPVPTRSTPSGPVPYFLWDRDITVDAMRAILADKDHPERVPLLALVLREARPDEVWEYVTPYEVADDWHLLEPRLGRKRAFWAWLLASWRELGYLR